MKRPNYQWALALTLVSATCFSTFAESQPATASTDSEHEFADNKQRTDKSQSQSPDFTSSLTTEQWQQRRFTPATSCPASHPKPSATTSPSTIDAATGQTDSSFLSAAEIIGQGQFNLSLRGDVSITTSQLKLAAGKLELDRTKGTFIASDRILLETPGALFSADSASGQLLEGQAELSQSQFYLTDSGANGSAEQLNLNPNTTLNLSNLTFSTCPQGDNSWRFSASELSINQQTGWGEAEDLLLRIGGVPVFYMPWLTFPVDDRRKSGLLLPTISDSTRNGIEYSQPIYWNIAPNYDATITPRYLQRRGTQLGFEFRYLMTESKPEPHQPTAEHSSQAAVAEVSADGQAVNLTAPSLPSNYHLGAARIQLLDDRLSELTERRRWSYELQHQSRFGTHWRARVEAAGVSDPWYFQDLGNDYTSTNQDRLTRYGQLGYFTSDLQFGISLLQFQPLAIAAESYRELPRWYLGWQPLAADSPWQWRLNAELTQFRSDDQALPEADRSWMESELSYNWWRPWGYAKPSLHWHYVHYDYQHRFNSQGQPVPAETISVAGFSFDSGLTFERTWGQKASADTMTQTLEPRVFMLYRPYRNQTAMPLFDTREIEFGLDSLFRSNRFIGPDRISDEQRIALGVNSRLFDSSGREVLTLGIGRSYALEPTQVALTQTEGLQQHSDPVAQIVWHPDNRLQFRADLAFDRNRNQTSQGRIGFIYEPRANFMVNVSHRFKDTASEFWEQSDLAFALPLSERWRMVGRWQYDLTEHKTQETFAGVEYESCCWAIRLVSRRYLSARLDANGGIIPGQSGRFNSDVYFQFIFKGMGGAQQKRLTRQLEDSIWSSESMPF